MEQKTIERIEKINTMDSDILPLVLIKAQELFWGLDRIIDENTDLLISEVTSNKKKLKVVKELLQEFGENVSTDYLVNMNGDFFSKELLKYLGFDVRDEITDDIIFDYCRSTDKNKDINLLKEKLIEAAIECDGIDEEAEFKALEEYGESGGRVYKGEQLYTEEW
ncbi:hypothetical protein ACIQ2D_21390 [Lysinibacillus sp. NPDC097287]|uniref:hypothetical protein n=1 Tax=Lysinibacillus sp. NPDC097287 TaxID=3364144 RepID=UPI0038229FB5